MAPANALLKAIEEPAPRTVWILCAPSAGGRAAHDPVPLPAGRARHPAGRGGRRRPRPRATASTRRRPRSPPAPRSGTSAGPAGWRSTRPAGSAAPRCSHPGLAARRRGACLVGRGQPGRRRGRGGAGRHRGPRRRARPTRSPLGARPGLEPTGSTPQRRAQLKDLEKQQKRRATRTQRDILDLAPARPGLVLPRRAGRPARRPGRARQRRRRPRHRDRGAGQHARAHPAAGRRDLDLPAAVAFNVAPLLAVEALMLALR